jgi:hypothetical protein
LPKNSLLKKAPPFPEVLFLKLKFHNTSTKTKPNQNIYAYPQTIKAHCLLRVLKTRRKNSLKNNLITKLDKKIAQGTRLGLAGRPLKSIHSAPVSCFSVCSDAALCLIIWHFSSSFPSRPF